MTHTPRKKEYVYYDPIAPAPKEVISYIIHHEPRSKEPEYKSTGKFPKIDEAIAAAKKHRNEQ